MFIVLEGLDSCGKSLQQKLLAQHLLTNGGNVVVYEFPSPGPAGYAARQLLHADGWWKHDDPHLRAIVTQAAMLADKYSAASSIRNALREGLTVVASRWTASAEVYGRADGLAIEWIGEAQADLIAPDINILIEVPVEVVCARMAARARDRYENEAFQTRVLREYTDLWERAPAPAKWLRVNGMRDREVVHREIWAHLCAEQRRRAF